MRRQLPAKGRHAAADELQVRAAEQDRGHRGGQPHPQGIRGRRDAADGVGSHGCRKGESCLGRALPVNGAQLRFPPSEFHPGYDEAREGQELSVVVNEPTLDAPEFFGSEATHDLEAFNIGCDVIVANRWGDELADVADKVYTRNLFKRN